MGEPNDSAGCAQGSDPDWVTCWQCAGHGCFEGCFEDACVCEDPPCFWETCDVCNGQRGWPREPAEEPR
jgi:hypothetical protein